MRVATLILLLFVATCVSGTEQVQFLHFDKTTDFPFSTVDNVMQDSYGYLWIGSYTGLARYDGYSFEVYTTQDKKNGLPSNRTFCTFETSNREIMVGTNLGLAVYNRQTNLFKLISYSCTSQICEDDYKQVWVATFDGIDIRDAKTLEIKKSIFCETDKNIKIFNTITRDSYGRIWALTANNGIYVFNSKSFALLKHIDSKKIKHIEQLEAYNMVFDKNGLLWLGTRGNGLICVDTSTYAIKTYLSSNTDATSLGSNNISNVYVDNKNDVWVCCQYGYLNKFNRKSNTFERYISQVNNSRFLNSNSISCINQDKSGNFWIGTFGNGLYCQSAMYNNFKTFIPSNNGSSKSKVWPVMSFVELDNGTIAFACDGGGIRFYNPKDNSVDEFVNNDQLHSKHITKIIKYKSCLWLATWGGGIAKIDLKTNAVTNFLTDAKNPNSINLNNIKALFVDNTSLIIGTHGDGLAYYNFGKNIFSHKRNSKAVAFNPEINNWINDIQKDSKGNLWISTFYGLHRLYKNTLTHYGTTKSSKSINNFEVLSTIEDKNKQLWVLTSQGIDLFDYKSSTFKHISELYSLPSGSRSLLIDNNDDLWLSTTDKLFRISLKNNKVFDYDKNDGIVTGEFTVNASFKSSDGTLYFGSADGFMKWKPSELKEDTINPKIVFRNLYVNYKKQLIDSVYLKRAIETSDTLAYDYTSDVISVEVAAILLGRPDKINYSYRLDNEKNSWLNLGKGRTISLTALSPGIHRLRVKASVEHGVEVERVLIVIVSPKWWMTWWFKSFVIILILALIARINDLRLKKIRNKNILLEKIVKERTIELEQANVTLTQQSETLKNQAHSLHKQNNSLAEKQQLIEQKNSQLENALATKDKIINILAHDFKNPLHGINGLATILKDRTKEFKNDSIQKCIDGILSSSTKLNDQMTVVLDWARGQVHDLVCKKVEVNIETIINDSINLVEGSSTQKEIAICTQMDYTTNAFVDSRMISTVVRNVLINAIKFTPKGGKINIIIQEYDSGIEINIIDSGVGMKAEIAQNLFKHSHVESERGTENEEGLGMGLQICKSFVEKNDGTISVQSKEGEGSVFTITIPKGQELAVRIVPEIVNEESETNNNTTENLLFEVDKSKTIVIIDDNPDLLVVLQSIFEPYYSVFTANDGKIGLQLARNMVPDLIISDIQMPYLNGIELCKAIKQDEMTNHIPVVLITSQSTNETQINSYKSGADDFIQKPVDKNIILFKTKAILENRKKLLSVSEDTSKEKVFLLPDSQEDLVMKRIVEVINENFKDSEFDVNVVAVKIGISRAQLWRKFKSTTGTNISDYILELRMKLALEMLNTGKYRTSEIAYDVGYTTPAYFTKCFVSYFGESPKEYVDRINKLNNKDL